MPQSPNPDKAKKIDLAQSVQELLDLRNTLIAETEKIKKEQEDLMDKARRAKHRADEAKDTYRAFGFALKDRESRLMEEENLYNKEVVAIQKNIYDVNTELVNARSELAAIKEDIADEQEFLSELKSREVQCKSRIEDSVREITELQRCIEREKNTLRTYEEKRFMVENDILERKQELVEEQKYVAEQKTWIEEEKDKITHTKLLLTAFSKEHRLQINF